ncbi:hypothetical protein [Clostridium sp.]|uniref:hypothetical protein n=1 Tax=Clostridium sp. TaxID=1506 RepID=UPI002846E36B|nr:hypothetical protein [Clostridium sp.]MDR3597085.1 hypothetical protein [Clostridium sp.]
MALTNLKTLSTSEKLAVLHTSAGGQQLEEWLVSGLSLSKIARILDIQTDTMYRWCRKYPDITAIVAPYAHIVLEDLTKPLAYRIIYAYDAYGAHFKGCVMEEYSTLEEVWSSIFVQQYFNSFGKSEVDYYESYIAAMQSTGCFKLSHWYLIAYYTLNRKGLIKPQKPPI